MSETVCVLAIEDDENHAELLRECLSQIESTNVEFRHATDRQSASNELAAPDIDIVFLDYHLGAEDGLEILREMRAKGDERPVIVLTGQGDEYVAVDMMRAGADDYIIKDDLGTDKVIAALDRAIAKINSLAEYQEAVAGVNKRLNRLTAREREVMDLVIEGQTTKEICQTLCRSESTIKIHRSRVMQKMEANTPADLARMVMSLRGANTTG